MNHINSLKGAEVIIPLRDRTGGAQVLVCRDKTQSWEGPFQFMNIYGEAVVVKLARGRKHSDRLSSRQQMEAL